MFQEEDNPGKFTFRSTPWIKSLHQQIQSMLSEIYFVDFFCFVMKFYPGNRIQLTTFQEPIPICRSGQWDCHCQYRYHSFSFVQCSVSISSNQSSTQRSWLIYRSLKNRWFHKHKIWHFSALQYFSGHHSDISDPGTVLGFSAILLPQLGQVGPNIKIT